MTINMRLTASFNMGNLRSFGAVILLIVHLVGGTLHGACGLSFQGGHSSVSCQMSDQSEGSDSALLSHHCHGCFAVVIPVSGARVIEATIACVLKWTAISVDGLSPPLDTPPPKMLT